MMTLVVDDDDDDDDDVEEEGSGLGLFFCGAFMMTFSVTNLLAFGCGAEMMAGGGAAEASPVPAADSRALSSCSNRRNS